MKIKDCSAKHFKYVLTKEITNAVAVSGCRMEKEEVRAVISGAAETLLYDFGWYPIDKLVRAIKKGSSGQLGDFAGISVRTICDWLRAYNTVEVNAGQDEDVTTSRPAPQGSGNDDLDTKRNIMAMWAAMKTWRDDIPDVERRLGGNWGREYAYLKAHGLVSEPQGWLDDYRERAVNYIRGGEDGTAGSIRGIIRGIIRGRRMREEILRDGGQVMDTVYRLRVTDTVKSWLEASFDGFNTWFNSVTQDTPSAFVTLTNDLYRFKIN